MTLSHHFFFTLSLFFPYPHQTEARSNPPSLKKDLFLSRINFPEKKGQLPSPINNLFIKKTNLEKMKSLWETGHQKFDSPSPEKNFYKVDKKEKVRAVATGRVVFSSYLKTYGPTVIIDHGKNYYSIYGNLQRVFVKKGDLVRSLESIGQLGRYHLQFKMSLYFEIRHFAKTLLTSDWLKTTLNPKRKDYL